MIEQYILAILSGLSLAGLTGLFVWVFKMNADISVLKEKARVTEHSLEKNTESNQQLADAINDLKVVIEGMKRK